MSSSSPLPPPHLRKPLDSQKGAGGDMSMMFFVQPDCPSRFPHQDEHRVRGLNAETIARIFLPPPSWLLTAEYAPLRLDTDDSPTSIFFSLNLSIYNQPVKQRDGLESETGDTLIYTMPALVVRDQGYQPILPRLFASMDNFPCIPPIVSFTGFILGPAPGIPDKIPFRGFHQFEVFVIFPIHANPWAILCKVAGLLSHRVMIHPPGSDRDYVFIVVPDSWTFLDKATSTAAASSSAISTPLKENRPPLRPLSGIYSLPLTPWQHLVPSRQVLHLRL
ncbi:hypothetical protein HRG_012569 [Hirsutella rhossiliensis]